MLIYRNIFWTFQHFLRMIPADTPPLAAQRRLIGMGSRLSRKRNFRNSSAKLFRSQVLDIARSGLKKFGGDLRFSARSR
jgi:hypothetical protein